MDKRRFTRPKRSCKEIETLGIMSGLSAFIAKTMLTRKRKKAAPSIGTALVAVKVEHERTGNK